MAIHTDQAGTGEQQNRKISIPKPRITVRGVGLVILFWLLYSILLAGVITRAEEGPFVGVLVGQVVNSTIMAVSSLPVWWLVVREMDSAYWGWVVAVHLLIAPLYGWGTVEAFLGVARSTAPSGVSQSLEARQPWLIVTNVTMYVIQFSIYHLVRNVHRLQIKERQTTKLLAQAREQELAALKAQINPHFLFNTLNSISATLKRDPQQAREMIAELAGMMRYALDSSSQEWVSLGEEITFVERYLDLERHRFSDRLSAEVDVPEQEDIRETPVPPMVLQPLVENALRHGIAPSENGGTIRVRISQTDDTIDVQVDDTGVGPDRTDPLSAESNGVGLANTSARLKRVYGPAAALQTAPNRPRGFSVWFSIPKNDGTAPTE